MAIPFVGANLVSFPNLIPSLAVAQNVLSILTVKAEIIFVKIKNVFSNLIPVILVLVDLAPCACQTKLEILFVDVWKDWFLSLTQLLDVVLNAQSILIALLDTFVTTKSALKHLIHAILVLVVPMPSVDQLVWVEVLNVSAHVLQVILVIQMCRAPRANANVMRNARMMKHAKITIVSRFANLRLAKRISSADPEDMWPFVVGSTCLLHRNLEIFSSLEKNTNL
jgi:hypothetical protein